MLAAGATIFGILRGPGARWNRIATQSEILQRLPDGSAKTALLAIIEDEITSIRTNADARRDWPMFIASLIIAPVLVVGAIGFGLHDRWWGSVLGVALGLLAVLFIYGIFEAAAKVPRDDKGHRIPSETTEDGSPRA